MVLAAGCSGGGGAGASSGGSDGGASGSNTGNRDVGLGSAASLPPVTADDGGVGWEGATTEVLNSASFQFQDNTNFGYSALTPGFGFDSDITPGGTGVRTANTTGNPFTLANFHFGLANGVELNGSGQTVALLGQSFDTEWDELIDKTDEELIIFAGDGNTIVPTHRESDNFDRSVLETGIHENGDNRAAVLLVGEDDGDSSAYNHTPHVGLIAEATAHLSTYLSFDLEGYEAEVEQFSTMSGSAEIAGYITWEGYGRATDATLDAAASHNAIFQANDWYANKGRTYRDFPGQSTVYAGHYVTITPVTFSGTGATHWAAVSPTHDQVMQKLQSDPTLSYEQAISAVLADTVSSTSVHDSITNPSGDAPPSAADAIDRDAPVSTGWSDYLDAIRQFGNTGIVGWSLEERFPIADEDGGNSDEYARNPQDTSAPVMAALPEQYADLEPFWIAVGGMSATIDDTGNITNAERSTGSCHETARYCLMAPGNARFQVTGIDPDNATLPTESQSGSKIQLAMVGAAAAMVNQAFTLDGEAQLSPSEIRDRLLASANNTFIIESGDFEYRHFANNVFHAYNDEFGHGLLDVRAALEPIGEQTIQIGTQVNQSSMSVQSAQVSTTASVGNALALSLGDTQLATFDALGTPFYMRAANLIKIDVDDVSNFGDELERFAKAGSFMSSEPGDLTDGWQQAFGGAPLATLGNGFMLSPETVAIAGNYQPVSGDGNKSAGWRFHSGSTAVMAQGFGLAPVADDVFANSISILPTDGVSYGAVQAGEASSIGAFAFVEEDGGQFESTGFAFARASALPGGGLGTLGLVMKSEDYAFMGLKSRTSDTDDFSGLAGALNFSAQWNLSNQILGKTANSGSIFFNAEYGMAEGEGAALVQGFDTTTFSGYAVGLRFNEVLNDSDTLTLSVRQPLRVESGAANFQLARGRDADRNINFDNFAASLSPEARQIDFGARYGWNVDASTRINIGGYYSMNENHIAGEEGGAFMLAVSKKF